MRRGGLAAAAFEPRPLNRLPAAMPSRAWRSKLRAHALRGEMELEDVA
jgi:hypothetical protein